MQFANLRILGLQERQVPQVSAAAVARQKCPGPFWKRRSMILEGPSSTVELKQLPCGRLGFHLSNRLVSVGLWMLTTKSPTQFGLVPSHR